MAYPSTSTSFSEDKFLHETITSTHGEKYQKELALIIFERATRKAYDFQLGYDMAIADKFDDVAFFNNTKKEWILIKTKHADTSKGTPSPLNIEMLLPKNEVWRERGDFSLYKYFKSYMTVQANIKERKSVVIFTNRDILENFHEQSFEVEPRQMDEILNFDCSRHIGLKAKDSLINEMLDYANRDFNLLKDSIINLFKMGTVNQVIKNFNTPVASILTKTKTSVKFSEVEPSEAHQMLMSLKSDIDIRNAQVPIDKCKELFTRKSRNKTWPLLANEDTVHQFFQNFILSVQQPEDLRGIIDQDMRYWMRTWIQPAYFQRLEEPYLDVVSVKLERFFDLKQSQREAAGKGSFYKYFLQKTDGEAFFESIKKDLENKIKIERNSSDNNVRQIYVSRRLSCSELPSGKSYPKDNDLSMIIHDREFIDELSGKLKNQRFFLLTAEPGMGKSTVLEFIAFEAQRKSSDHVYIFYLNKFHKKLEQLKTSDTFDEHLTALEAVLSDANFNSLHESFKHHNFETKYFLLFDAFDELHPSNRGLVLQLFKEMLQSPNIKILVSGRRTVKALVEDEMHVKAMSLLPLDTQDQIDFLRQFWKVHEHNEGSFRNFVDYLFKNIQPSIKSAFCKFAGLPLILKMLAEVHTVHFEEFLSSEQTNYLSYQETFIVDLYESFIKKCFDNKLEKKFISLKLDSDEENDPWIEKLKSKLFSTFTLEHQLLAIKQLQIKNLEFILKCETFNETLSSFEKRIVSGTEKSPLVEILDNKIRFANKSYAEFLVAQFLYLNMEKYEAEILEPHPEVNLFDKYSLIRMIFFSMIELHYQPKHLEIIERHYRMNSRIALWACEVQGQKTVEFLLRTMCDSTIISQLLGVAAQHNCYNICSFLLESKGGIVDCQINGKTPLHIAAGEGHLDVVKFLIDHNADINAKGIEDWTPLHFAAENGHLQVVKILTDHSGNVNATNKNGLTPLHLAAKSSSLVVLKTLIEHSGNVNEQNLEGLTPLHIAAANGHTELVKLQIEHSGDINAKENKGWTPLHFAAEKGHTDVVKFLINHFGDIDAKNNEGSTPLHLAAGHGYSDIVRLLIDHSADIGAQDNSKRTSLDLAVQLNQMDVIEILTENASSRGK